MDSSLPKGTVTFLFTDIAGSTRLLQALGADRYAELLADHRVIMRSAFEAHSGREVDTQGDSFFASFPRASDAVNAAVQIQQALAKHNWPDDVEVRVRMGLHTGEPWLVEEGYVGMDVHRAARIGHCGHGGQVLLSETTTSLMRGELPQGVEMVDLGRHRLKDLRRPERIHQLLIDGLPTGFPPLSSLELVSPPGVTGAKGETHTPRQVGASPYRGLAAFQETDAAFFFGREAFTDKLVASVAQQQLVAVIVGPSGSGKSSTVFAGLLPQLRLQGDWLILQVRPGREPFQALAGALLPLLEPELSRTDRLVEAHKLAQSLQAGELGLLNVVASILESHPEARRLLLVIDQFEELYTLCSDPAVREAFHDELLAAVDAAAADRQPIFSLLLTLRADFMGQALAHRPFADALQDGSILLGPMNRAELRAAIEQPAELQGAAFETGLVERLLDDVGQEPGNLPLLEFALTLLWDKMDRGWLTHAAYEAIGRVEGALARFAEEVYGKLTPAEQEAARRAFVQLVQPGEGTEDTRRIATRADLVGVDWLLIQHLADERLVVTGRDELSGETVEVVHEALIRGWGRLREWMAEDREFRTWQEGLRAALRAWNESGQDDGALLRGAPLANAEDWLGGRAAEIGQVEGDYIRAGAAFREKRERVRERRRRLIMGGLGIGFAVAVGLSIFAFNRQGIANRLAVLADQSAATAQAEAWSRATQQAAAEAAQRQTEQEAQARATAQVVAENQTVIAETERQRAETEARLALSRNLAVDALNNLAADPQLSLLLAIQAVEQTYSVDGSYLPGVPTALHRVIQANSRHLMRIEAEEGRVPYVSYSQDGTRLTAYQFHTGQDPKSFPVDVLTTIWDAFTGELLLELPTGMVADQWPTSDLVPIVELVDEISLQLSIWNVLSGAEVYSDELAIPFQTTHEDIVAMTLSPDGGKFALTLQPGRTFVWDLGTGQMIADLFREEFNPKDEPIGGETYFHTTLSSYVMFTPDSNSLITKHGCLRQASNCQSIAILRIWDLASPEADPRRTWFDESTKLAFSPDGNLMSDGWMNRTEIYAFEPPEDLLVIFDAPPSAEVDTLTYSRDSTLLATSSTDERVRVWDAAFSITTGGEVLRVSLPVPNRRIHQLSFSPEASRLATASSDGGIDIWDIQAVGGTDWLTLSNSPAMDEDQHVSIALSPDGRRLAVANADPTPRVWDTETGALLFRLVGHDKAVEHIAYSPRGDLIATCTHAGPLILWDVETGDEVARLNRYTDGECAIDFYSDGNSIAIGLFKNDAGWYQTLELPEFDEPGTEVLRLPFPLRGASLYAPLRMDLSSLGNRLAIAYDRYYNSGFKVWDPTADFEPDTLSEPSFIYLNVAYGPDGKRLAASRPNGSVEIWDEDGEEVLLTVSGHDGPIHQTTFSPDGARLATASADGTAKVWDAQTGEELMSLYGHTAAVTDVAFSPDGKKLYTASLDGTVRVYLMDMDELLALARSKLTRALTTKECQTYLHLDTCPDT